MLYEENKDKQIFEKDICVSNRFDIIRRTLNEGSQEENAE